MRIEKGQTYKLSANLDLKEVLYVEGVLEFDNTKNVKITTTKNIIVTGKLVSDLRNQPDLVHEIYFKDVDMTKFIGGGTDPIDSDIGLWYMGAGVPDLKGAFKTSYTTAKGSIPAGAKSIPLNDMTGWKKGDEIVIWSGDVKPQLGSRFYDRASKKYFDNYLECIERRIITGISGGQVLFDVPLRFKHEVFVSEPNKRTGQGRLFYPFVLNNTRNIKINGAEGKRAHIFACAHSHNADGSTAHNIMKHSVSNVEISYMGVRKWQPGGAGAEKGIDDIVTGRYAMHFHHAGDGTAGSLVENCAFHDNGARCCVPHMANGITFKRNTISHNLDAALWYDFQEMTHNINFTENMLVGILWDGVQLGGTAALLGIGDNNDFTYNILMYANQGDVDGSGAIQWTTDNEGVWRTKGNIIFCSHNADWTWQNSGRAHDIIDQIAVNCNFALTHGAYGNLYQYTRMEAYNSPVKVRASGPTFIDCVFDGMNKIPELLYVQTSAVGGDNNFHECELKNAPNGFTFDVYPHNEQFATPRTLNLVNNKYVNVNRKYQFIRSNGGNYPGIVPNCSINTQEGNAAKRIVPMTTESTIGKFAPDKFGTGDGLRTQIFRGVNFDSLLQDHVRALVREDDWRIEAPKFPNGAHYKLIMPDKVNQFPFSFRYTGKIEPYYTGAHRFRLFGGSGFRLWINNALVIDAPGNKHDNSEYKDSGLISMVIGNKYDIKVEVYEPGDRNMGIKLQWELPGKFGLRDLETSQLYSLTTAAPPVEPTIYKSVRMEKEYTRNNCGAGFTGSKYVFVVAAGMFISTISQADADSKALAHITANGQAEANTLGVCTKDPIIEPVKELKADAGVDFTSESAVVNLDGSGSTGDIKFINWYHDLGPVGWNIVSQNTLKTEANRLTAGAHLFRLVVTGTDGRKAQDTVLVTIGKKIEEPITFKSKEQTGTNTCIDGTVITAKVEAGKYTEATQALADAKALQELNRLLANCPVPWFTVDLPNGKKLYIFGTAEPYKFIVK
jgi:hypothetical protein